MPQAVKLEDLSGKSSLLCRAYTTAYNLCRSYLSRVKRVATILWLFTKDDFDTFVLPNTVFGTVAAIVEIRCAHFSSPETSISHILYRVPLTILFNWANLLIFDLANQRLPDSIAEDRINKPWRPLPQGLLTPRAVAQIMLGAMPLVLGISYLTGTHAETALLMVMTWMYNDLRGGDEHWILRNAIIAAAFFLYNVGSAKVAGGPFVQPGSEVWKWAGIVSAIIFTTMHVQDFKDQAGDRVRGRNTAPLTLGNTVARWTFAIPVIFWSIACTIGARVAIWYGIPALGLGVWVAWRSLRLRSQKDDRSTWKLWCLWCALLYGVPLTGEVFTAC